MVTLLHINPNKSLIENHLPSTTTLVEAIRDLL